MSFSSASTASTAVSEMGDGNDEMSEKQSAKSAKPAQNIGEAFFSRELQVEPPDMIHARPLRVHWPVDAKKLRGRDKQNITEFRDLPRLLIQTHAEAEDLWR